MQKFPLFSSLCVGFGLALTLGLTGCGDDGGLNDDLGDAGDGDGDGDTGDGDGDTGDGDADTSDTDGCFDAPEECLVFVRCIAAVADQDVEAEFGENGDCWCGSQAEAQECFNTCVAQVEIAMEQFPTAGECQENFCTLDELDPDEPYGPVVDGACPDWSGAAQAPTVNLFGTPGNFCSPACGGIAESCPEHSQTSADGTCFFSTGGENHCANRCYVDSTVLGGTQCQCGATCQQTGNPDGEGNLRGVCTFE